MGNLYGQISYHVVLGVECGNWAIGLTFYCGKSNFHRFFFFNPTTSLAVIFLGTENVFEFPASGRNKVFAISLSEYENKQTNTHREISPPGGSQVNKFRSQVLAIHLFPWFIW